jgi:hypothetical protein
VVIGVAPGGGQDDPQDHTSLPAFNKPPLKKFARSGDMIICQRLLHATPRLGAPSHPRMGAAC